MDFGVVVPSSWSPKQLVETATLAETSDLDFFLVTDHYLSRHTISTVDSWTALAAVAAKTERIRIGTCVTPIPFRPPQMLAKVVSTVDQISGGRSVLGVGAGWYRREFEAYSHWDEDRVRVAKAAEGLELIIKLWTSKEPFDFHGQFFEAKQAILEPKPIQKPHVPLWFGTTGNTLLKVAASCGEAWLPSITGHTMAEYESLVSRLRRFEALTRRTPKVKVYFNGTLKEVTEGIDDFAGLGCEGAILARTDYGEIGSAIKSLGKGFALSYR